jgi:hypothetical protein
MVLSAIFLTVCLGYSSIFFLKDPARHGFRGEHSVAIVGGMGLVVFGLMLLLSLYIWAAYYVEKFTIHGTTLSIRSMMQNYEFDLSELQSLTWKSCPVGGSIVFRIMGAKPYVEMYGYSHDDRLQIIKTMRDLVPASIQEGWPNFCHRVALPLRDGQPMLVRSEPSSQIVTVTRGRYDRAAAVVTPLSIVAAIVLWAWFNLWQFFALPILVLAGWLLLRFNVPPGGRVESRLTSTAQGRAQLFCLGTVMSVKLLMIGLRLGGVEGSTVCWIGCAILGTALVPILYMLHKVDKQRRIENEQAAKAAPDLWLQLPQARVPTIECHVRMS